MKMYSTERDNKHVILLEPPSFRIRNIKVARFIPPHLGIAYVAAMLRAAGYRVSVIDPRAEGLAVHECIARIREINPAAIGTTATTPNAVDAGLMSDAIKEQLPEMPIVLGGVHATVATVETMKKFCNIDFLVMGEGEETAVKLFDVLADDPAVPPRTINGVAYRLDGNIVVNEKQEGYIELDDLPYPAWDLFPLDRYKGLYELSPGRLQLPILTSRGCPYDCVFCSNIGGRKKMRYRKIENVLNEIEINIHKFNIGSLHFIDETMTMDMERAARLFNSMIERRFQEKIVWFAGTRADRLSPDILKLMKEAGCAYIGVGIESGNQEVLNRTGKKLDLKETRRAVDWITKAGITADVLFLIGLPYENQKTIHDTIRYARNLNAKCATFSIAIPYPGTKMREMGESGEGGIRLLSLEWEHYEQYMTQAMELETVSLRRLKFYHFLAYLAFYSKPGRIGNFIRKANILGILYYTFIMFFRRGEEVRRKSASGTRYIGSA